MTFRSVQSREITTPITICPVTTALGEGKSSEKYCNHSCNRGRNLCGRNGMSDAANYNQSSTDQFCDSANHFN